MRFLSGLVLCFISCSLTLAGEDTYRVGVFETALDGNIQKYIPLIYEAAKSNADMVVLPSSQTFSSIESAYGLNDYDELVQRISEASKRAGLYVVAHLIEKTICESKYELIRSNLVLDRNGHVTSTYRKPLNKVANCTTTDSEIVTFTTDFGVEFGLLMKEDLVLQKPEDLKDLKNFVVAGGWSSEIPSLSGPHFASSWAFTNKVNLVSSSGVFAGRNGATIRSDDGVTVVDLKKAGDESHSTAPPAVIASNLKVFSAEDLSQYTVRPLNVAASAKGYQEVVCNNGLCCDFYVKTGFVGPKEVSYGLAAFNGVRRFGKHNIGARHCAVLACAGPYKRTCTVESNSNSTNIIFEKLSIQTNSSIGNSQYPIILTGTQVQTDKFNFHTKITKNHQQTTLELSNVENVLSFGIFGRDFTKDSETDFWFAEELSFKDEMNEMFDYLWIRIRILIFVVSIYFLEMM